ncbi:phosphoribosyl-AMP cyclohydrolase [Propionibacteriaceae bacterium Y2011]
MTSLDPDLAARVRWNDDGLVPAVVQDLDSKAVLMLAWQDADALHRTLTTGRATYWSRSRQQSWVKGETSGHVQWVHGASLDCDGDTVLLTVRQVGAACHTGTTTCFDGRELTATVSDPLERRQG